MNLKTFTAGSMAEALALVKHELGGSAVILHTRTYRRGGILGLGGRQTVEIVATDDGRVGQNRRRSTRPQATTGRPTPGSSHTGSEPETTAGDLIRRTYAVAKAEFQAQDKERPTLASSPASFRESNPTTASSAAELAEEMKAVKRMVGRLMHQQQSPQSDPNVSDTLFDQYLFLLEQEVSQELAEQVIAQVRSTLGRHELDDEFKVRSAILNQISRLIPIDSSTGQFKPSPDGRPRTIALVGPTGVGKTTTIAKLAAIGKLNQKKKVGLITLDTYRIAAVDQLRTYANIIGVPLHVVLKPEEMMDAMSRCADCDVVFIDTAGRSQRDDPRLEQLASFIRMADPHEVHLVLSSTCTQSVLMETIDRFSRIRTDRIILTKLDEAVSFGVLLNVVSKVNKQLSYVTTGQEVPHQIEPGRAERLAALVLCADKLQEAPAPDGKGE